MNYTEQMCRMFSQKSTNLQQKFILSACVYANWLNLDCVHMYSLRLCVCLSSFYVSTVCFALYHPPPLLCYPPTYAPNQPPRWPTIGSDSGTTRTESLLPHTEMEPRPCPKWCPRPGLHSASERARWEIIWSGARGKWHYSGPSPSDTWEEVRCGGVCQECVRTRGSIGRAGRLYCEIRG